MTRLAFRAGHFDEAATLVERHHYSRRVPSNVQVVGTFHEPGGLFGDYGPAVAACIFAIPATRWSEEVWELARLVRNDNRIPLTPLIAQTVDETRRRGGDLLVSFADWTQGHHGGIYQAASWAYGGKRGERMDGLLMDGTFVPGRTCNHRWGTRSPTKLRQMLPGRDIQPHYDLGKHLYWKALGPRGLRKAERLGLASLPYPKPLRQEAAE